MRNVRRILALAVSLSASTAMLTQATTYTDATGDNYGPAYVDIASVDVTNDATNVTFTINLNPTANLLTPDGSQIYGKYLIGFQTGSPGSTAIQNPYGNPIGISSGTGMDYWIGSWADNSATEPFSGDAQLYRWNGSEFALAAGIGTNEPFIPVPVTLASTSTTIVVPIASLGLAPGASFSFDVWSTFGSPGGQSAYDALGKPTQTTAPGAPWEGTPYDSSTAGAGGASTLLTYTLTGAATSSSWTADANGTWTNAANWSAGVPNGAGHVATFAGPISSPRTVTLDAPQTVGSLTFTSATAFTIASATNALTLDATMGPASITVSNGSHTVSAGLTLADDLAVSVAGGSTLNSTGTLTANGHNLTKTGAGTAQFANVRAGALTVSEGTLRLSSKATNASATGTSSVTALTINAGAKLDLANNSLIVGYTSGAATTTLQDVRGHLASGRLVGAPAVATAGLAVGYADNAVLNRTTFDGQPVAANSILIGLTLKGDTNLDRAVNFDDLLALAQAYGQTTGGTWQRGDSDYNGAVNFDDLLALAQVYGSTALANGTIEFDAAANFESDWALAQSLVPEPAALSGFAVFTLVRRKR